MGKNFSDQFFYYFFKNVIICSQSFQFYFLRIYRQVKMFNPQRKSKIADIYMQQKSFQKHIQKMKDIKQSKGPKSARYSQQQRQIKYLKRLALSKHEVKSRLSNHLNQENHRVFMKLIKTEKRAQQYPQVKLQKKYFNSYVNGRKEAQRINNENMQFINRMIKEKSVIPPLNEMKKQYKRSRKYSKMVQKLPSILKHQEEFKRDLSMRRLDQSKSSIRSSKKHLKSQRSSTQMQQIHKIQKDLLQKQSQIK